MHVTFEPWRRLRTAVDSCRAPAVYCDNMERIARRQGATREEELLFSFLSFPHTHTPVKVRRRDPSVVHFGTQRWIAAARFVGTPGRRAGLD